MYSRYQDNSKRPIRLPEHYGGSAFSQGPTEPITVSLREPPKPFLGGVGEKASPVAERMLRAEAFEEPLEDPVAFNESQTIDTKAEAEECAEQAPTPPTPKKSAALPPFHFEGLRHLFDGIGGEGDHDRLLLLGLILLLSRSGEESDILLWLSLLLLCG